MNDDDLLDRYAEEIGEPIQPVPGQVPLFGEEPTEAPAQPLFPEVGITAEQAFAAGAEMGRALSEAPTAEEVANALTQALAGGGDAPLMEPLDPDEFARLHMNVVPSEPVDPANATPDTLFGDDESFHRHWNEWQGMPEYQSEQVRPHSSILVHFMSREDREAFAKLVAQPVSPQTRSLFYPRLDWDKVAKLRWKSTNDAADTERRKMGQTGALYHGKTE